VERDGGYSPWCWFRGGSLFDENVRRKAGNGADIYFWSDTWLWNVTFRDRFRRLFYLSENRWMTMADLFRLGWGEGGHA